MPPTCAGFCVVDLLRQFAYYREIGGVPPIIAAAFEPGSGIIIRVSGVRVPPPLPFPNHRPDFAFLRFSWLAGVEVGRVRVIGLSVRRSFQAIYAPAGQVSCRILCRDFMRPEDVEGLRGSIQSSHQRPIAQVFQRGGGEHRYNGASPATKVRLGRCRFKSVWSILAFLAGFADQNHVLTPATKLVVRGFLPSARVKSAVRPVCAR